LTWQMLVIALVRIFGSLPVLRWPLAGSVLAVLVDLSDLFLMNALGGVRNYQAFDKYLDQVYMALFLVVAMRWPPGERRVSIGLYVFRLAGFLAFELSGSRTVLLFFPNFFEAWFLLVAGLHALHVERPWSRPGARIAVAGLFAAKVVQEFVLHEARLLDSFTAFEAVEWLWRTLSRAA
jgi:hypothetical protein